MIYDESFEEFKPLDFYEIANKLKSDSSNNAVLRTIVSRAYYAAFLQLRECFIEKDFDDCSEDMSHSKLRDLLEDEDFQWRTKPFRDTVFDKIYVLWKNRAHCDYKFKCPDTDYSKKGWAELVWMLF